MDTDQHSSVQGYIGSLQEGEGTAELMRLADELRALRASSGWRELGELLSIEHARLDRLAVARQRELPAGSFDELVKRETVRAHEAGLVAGLHKARQIIDSVVSVAEAVQAELERGN